MNITELEKNKCTGCSACKNICPTDAIHMEYDEEGFLFPILNENKCVNCSLCYNQCPELNPMELKLPAKAFQVVNTSKDYMNSSSGGAAYLIAKQIIEENGVVYAATYNEQLDVEHQRITFLKDLPKMQGSKYVQSRFTDVYHKCKKDLNDGKKVLVIGTPCQIASIKRFCKNVDNLYTIDLVCHGVPSPKFFKKHIEFLKSKFEFDRIRFRFKNWNTINLYAFILNGKNKKIVYSDDDAYYNAFIKNESLRKSCYSCQYSTKNRIGDLTLGDSRVSEKDKSFYPFHCKSMVTCNSLKGEQLFSEVNCEHKEFNYLEEAKVNHSLIAPVKQGLTREKIYKDLKELSYNDFLKKYTPVHSNKYLLKRKLEYLVPYKIKRLVRMVLNK